MGQPMIWHFTREHIVDGEILFIIDGAMSMPVITEFDDDASELQTKISAQLGVTVTGGPGEFDITCDDDDTHTMEVVCNECFGDQVYEVIWSNPTTCCIWGGVDLAALEDFTDAPDITATISPSGSSVGPWTITITGADSGFYDITADGGDPVSTAFGSCPTIAGFTSMLNPDGTCTVTGDGMAHTLVMYKARLRSHPPKQIPFYDPLTGCVALMAISSTNCPES